MVWPVLKKNTFSKHALADSGKRLVIGTLDSQEVGTRASLTHTQRCAKVALCFCNASKGDV